MRGQQSSVSVSCDGSHQINCDRRSVSLFLDKSLSDRPTLVQGVEKEYSLLEGF